MGLMTVTERTGNLGYRCVGLRQQANGRKISVTLDQIPEIGTFISEHPLEHSRV